MDDRLMAEVEAEFEADLDDYLASWVASLTRNVSGPDRHGRHGDPYRYAYDPNEARDQGGRWTATGGGKGAARGKLAQFGSATWANLKSAGAAAGHVEHAAKEWVKDRVGERVDRLPPKWKAVVTGVWRALRLGATGAFATWTAGQALAKQVAREKGATPEQAAQLRATLSAVDIASCKPVTVTLGAVGLGAAALPASFVPVGSITYLAHSTARDPLATIRAARKLVARLARRGDKKDYARPSQEVKALVEQLLEAVKVHDGNDRYFAILLAALDHTGDLWRAIRLADEAIRERGYQPPAREARRYARWDEADHPSGQPDNRGQFRPVGRAGHAGGRRREAELGERAVRVKKLLPTAKKMQEVARGEKVHQQVETRWERVVAEALGWNHAGGSRPADVENPRPVKLANGERVDYILDCKLVRGEREYVTLKPSSRANKFLSAADAEASTGRPAVVAFVVQNLSPSAGDGKGVYLKFGVAGFSLNRGRDDFFVKLRSVQGMRELSDPSKLKAFRSEVLRTLKRLDLDAYRQQAHKACLAEADYWQAKADELRRAAETFKG